MHTTPRFFTGDWQERMSLIVETMREMSLQTDPQAMVRAYAARVRQMMPVDRSISISRRDLEPPQYKITRSSTWSGEINPWKEPGRLPVFEGGLLGSLLYGNEPRIIDDLEFAADDPAAEFLEGQGSLMAVPQFDGGIALNMVVLMRKARAAFDPELFPEWVWLSNLFGRATHNLVLTEQVKRAYHVVERELKLVADLQHSLLPKRLPKIPTLDLAVYYQTSQWAGGDYYDVFPLPDGRWGLLIADVSGHGTPAAVMMAVTHSIAHAYPGHPEPPGRLLSFINHHLTKQYTSEFESFVTAFYGIYDPSNRELNYACAGHNAPRLKRCEDGSVHSLDAVGELPLGLFSDQEYHEAKLLLRPGDQIIFYTDGITEATDASGRMFGVARLDEALANCHLTADGLIENVLSTLNQYTGGAPAADDRTMLVAKVS